MAVQQKSRRNCRPVLSRIRHPSVYRADSLSKDYRDDQQPEYSHTSRAAFQYCRLERQMFKSVQRVVMDENSDWTLLWKQVCCPVHHLPEAIASRPSRTHVFGRWKVGTARMCCLGRSSQRAFLSAWISPSICTVSFRFACR